MKVSIIPEMLRFSGRQGFVIPLTFSISFTIIAGASASVLQSSDRKKASILQQQVERSLAIAERGVARSLSSLRESPPLLPLTYGSNNLCAGRTYLDATLNSTDGNEEITDIKARGAITSAPHWVHLNEIQLATQMGMILVQEENPQSTAVSFLQPAIKLGSQPDTNPVLRIVAQEIRLGNDDILGAVSGNIGCIVSNQSLIPNIANNCHDGHCKQQEPRNAIKAGPNSTVQSKIYILARSMLPLHTALTHLCESWRKFGSSLNIAAILVLDNMSEKLVDRPTDDLILDPFIALI